LPRVLVPDSVVIGTHAETLIPARAARINRNKQAEEYAFAVISRRWLRAVLAPPRSK